ncbi:hypothetical protein [Streptomyces sp. NPDC101237]|uniref:hypothetical protein n=1 Tax=Streptomyces sp. NPDC101237 TaxID=3366139 RepID=UPI00382D50E6
MTGSEASADVPARPGALLPLLGTNEEVVAFFAGVADLDATNPADYLLEDGVRLASGCAQGQDCRYSIQLDWVADSKHGTTTLGNDGQGFLSNGAPPKIPTYRFESGPNGPALRK